MQVEPTDRGPSISFSLRHDTEFAQSLLVAVGILKVRSPPFLRLAARKTILCLQPSFIRAFDGSPTNCRLQSVENSVDRLDRTRSEPDDNFLSLSVPLPCQAISMPICANASTRIRAPNGTRRSPRHSRPARVAATSSTCLRHNRAHDPSRAWHRDCREKVSAVCQTQWRQPHA